MNRFSPEFAATLRKKVGDRVEFRRARRAFAEWKSACASVVISPFVAYYTAPVGFDRPDCARDIAPEYYSAPFNHEGIMSPGYRIPVFFDAPAEEPARTLLRNRPPL